MTRVAITGAHGFLGWHLSCRLRARHGVDAVRLGREDFADAGRLRDRLAGVDTVFHVAGVNRADSDDAVERGNIELAEALVAALERDARGGNGPHVVYANSIQADSDSPYGKGKRRAAEVLASAAGSLADVVLPNLFGEGGRPAYNSFVATFAHEVAQGRQPSVTGDRPVPLLHAQDAAAALIAASDSRTSHQVRPPGEPHRVSDVLSALQRCHETYAERGELPDLSTPFAVNLFNTYRAFLFPERYPFRPQVHADERGALFESVRAHGGTGQVFVSTTVPGATRGNHYHLRKVERFAVVHGEAEIALRRLYGTEVVRFRVTGDEPSFVDMPTLWVHNITNVGDAELITLFWADQLLDPIDPDQYPEQVEVGAA